MKKTKVFISSVQGEFEQERQMLFNYLMQDALLGLFFEPFIFENLPASAQSVVKVYLNEVEKSDVYLGLFGEDYGFEDKDGISPTEHEFNLATKLNKTRLIFITNHSNESRHKKETALIRKAEQDVIRKKFASQNELKTSVYASLIRYLEEKEFIRTGPFDASVCRGAGFEDIYPEKVKKWVQIAKNKRGFPLPPQSPIEEIFEHLNLGNKQLTNAALLLFGKEPQKFFISSEIKCAQFYGIEIVKPIPAYHVYKGDVFQLVDQAVDFVLSRIDVSTGTRDKSVQVDIDYEIPRAVVAEAIVNAVAHRDYTSTGSVQVMLFKNRLEIWNPGKLPSNLTLSKLRKSHGSFPANPLLAEPMYLSGYIERLGTGTRDMIRLCKEKKLKEPDFKQEDVFKTIIWRKNHVVEETHGRSTGELSGEATGELSGEVKRVIIVLNGEQKRSDIQKSLQLKHDDYFRLNYIIPAIESHIIELKYPDIPNHPKQKYRLTKKGLDLKKQFKNNQK